MEADIHDVAEALGLTVTDEAIDLADQLAEIVDLGRQNHAEAGIMALAGVWLGQGMPVTEIAARLWPRSRCHLTVAH